MRVFALSGGKFPILDGAGSNGPLESGRLIGNMVLVAPELL
jgi:hypothetical protein